MSRWLFSSSISVSISSPDVGFSSSIGYGSEVSECWVYAVPRGDGDESSSFRIAAARSDFLTLLV